MRKKGISEAGGRLGNWGDRSYGESISRERTVPCQMMLLQALGLKPLLIWSRRFHPAHRLAVEGIVWHLLALNTYIPFLLLLMASGSSLRFKYQICRDPVSMSITMPCPPPLQTRASSSQFSQDSVWVNTASLPFVVAGYIIVWSYRQTIIFIF